VVLIEILSATLRLATFESCDRALYRRDFDRDFGKRVRQLVQAVEGVGNGTWTILVPTRHPSGWTRATNGPAAPSAGSSSL
jgi:hypothetical protein